MATTTVSEYVSRLMSDKKFLLEACRNIPDELVQDERAPEGAEDATNEEALENLGNMMGRYFSAASEAMGYGFGEDEVAAECKRQLGALKGFAKVRFIVRFLKTLVKAGKGKKRK